MALSARLGLVKEPYGPLGSKTVAHVSEGEMKFSSTGFRFKCLGGAGVPMAHRMDPTPTHLRGSTSSGTCSVGLNAETESGHLPERATASAAPSVPATPGHQSPLKPE